MIKKQIRILLAGVMVVAPFAVTVYVVWWAGSRLDGIANAAIKAVSGNAGHPMFPGAGAIILVAGIYLVGLLTHLWAFRWIVGLLEGLLSRMPVVKTVYESVRDILKIFGGDADQMGQVVRYRVPGTDVDLLGIMTSTRPAVPGDEKQVAVYLPMSYQLGGFTVYVRPESVIPVDMSVEEAMKIAATAGAGSPSPSQPTRQRAQDDAQDDARKKPR